MRNFLIFLQQELFYSGKNFSKFLQNILFFLICCFVFLMLMQGLQGQENKELFVQMIIWISLLFATFFSSSEILQEDFKDGTLEQMIIFCENFEVYIAAKMLGAWLIFALPIILISPLLMIMIGFEGSQIKDLTSAMIFASLSISCVSSFCAGFSVMNNRSPLLAILAMPLLIPVLLLSFALSVKLLVGVAVFLGVLSVVGLAKVVKLVVE